MRRQGQYADPGANTYGAGRMQHMPGQRMEQNSGPFQGQLEAFTPEREQPYVTSKSERQWRWERDGSKVSHSMTPQMFNEGMFIPDLSHFFLFGRGFLCVRNAQSHTKFSLKNFCLIYLIVVEKSKIHSFNKTRRIYIFSCLKSR